MSEEEELAKALIDRTWKAGLMDPELLDVTAEIPKVQQGVEQWVQTVLDTGRPVTRRVLVSLPDEQYKFQTIECLVSLYAEEENETEHWHVRVTGGQGRQLALGVGAIASLLFAVTTKSLNQSKLHYLEPLDGTIYTELGLELCWHADLSECPLVSALRQSRARFHEMMHARRNIEGPAN